MPTVARLSIAPVRGLALEHPAEIDLTEHGVREDRRFYLTDAANRLVDGLILGSLVKISAHTDPAAEHLRLVFPDGTVIDGDIRLGAPIETPIYRRTAQALIVEGPWAEALSAFCGREIRLLRCERVGGTRSGHPATLVTDGSLELLRQHLGVDSLDSRRFRMLIELEGGRAHEEDDWIGGRIAVGEAVLQISGPVARCAITTYDPRTGQRDLDTLRTIIAYRGLTDGKDVDFGVLGEVERAGRIRIGDAVSVLDPVAAV
ncbi:MAG: MOSC domain-containing protein [Chloroflexi bacterium]|nr:MOSC domain-containing protein [Chloroflexota bacterium]